jgi:hypothetical protein
MNRRTSYNVEYHSINLPFILRLDNVREYTKIRYFKATSFLVHYAVEKKALSFLNKNLIKPRCSGVLWMVHLISNVGTADADHQNSI